MWASGKVQNHSTEQLKSRFSCFSRFSHPYGRLRDLCRIQDTAAKSRLVIACQRGSEPCHNSPHDFPCSPEKRGEKSLFYMLRRVNSHDFSEADNLQKCLKLFHAPEIKYSEGGIPIGPSTLAPSLQFHALSTPRMLRCPQDFTFIRCLR